MRLTLETDIASLESEERLASNAGELTDCGRDSWRASIKRERISELQVDELSR